MISIEKCRIVYYLYILKSPKQNPKPEGKKPDPARNPEGSGPARPKPENFRPVTSLPTWELQKPLPNGL